VNEDEQVQEHEEDEGALREENVRAVRIGHGANCSSVGSVIDTLFLGAAVGGAIVAAVFAAMKVEPITVVGGESEPNSDGEEREGKGT
jgi:hypothetical protein